MHFVERADRTVYVRGMKYVRVSLMGFVLCSSDAHGQTSPAYRGYVGVFAGVGVLIAGEVGDAVGGPGPVLAAVVGRTIADRTSAEAEIAWLRAFEPQFYKNIALHDTVDQFQVDVLLRRSLRGPPYDVDLVGGVGIFHRNFKPHVIIGSGQQGGFNFQFGVDVTKWWNNVGLVTGLRTSIAPEARPFPPAPFRPSFLFSGGVRRRF
jgi:hypothetical protein